MTNKLVIVQEGESLPFKFDRGGASIEGWTCQIKVKQKPSDLPDIDRNIPADNDDRAWSDFLTKTETLNLKTGLWYITGVLSNLGTQEQEEIPVRFQVTKSWALVSQVAAVVATPGTGSFSTSVSVSLAAPTVGATIFFTTDGTDPTVLSQKFAVPIEFLPAGSPHTLKAFARLTNFKDSGITKEIYTVT